MSNTEIETYALGLICEESGEAQQIVGKALRFGIDTPGVKDPLTGHVDMTVTPRMRLEVELGDLFAAADYAIARGMLDGDKIAAARIRKRDKLLNPESTDNLGRRLAP